MLTGSEILGKSTLADYKMGGDACCIGEHIKERYQRFDNGSWGAGVGED